MIDMGADKLRGAGKFSLYRLLLYLSIDVNQVSQ